MPPRFTNFALFCLAALGSGALVRLFAQFAVAFPGLNRVFKCHGGFGRLPRLLSTTSCYGWKPAMLMQAPAIFQ